MFNKQTILEILNKQKFLRITISPLKKKKKKFPSAKNNEITLNYPALYNSNQKRNTIISTFPIA